MNIEITDPVLAKRIENVAAWYGKDTDDYAKIILADAIARVAENPNLTYLMDLD